MIKTTKSIQKKCARLLVIMMGAFVGSALADEAVPETASPFSIKGYLETYYIHDFDRSSSGERPNFTFSHNESGKPSINLGLIQANLTLDNFRANLALGSGTYMRTNYVLEPDDLQKVYEANIGIKLSDQHNIWLDAGVMPSHVGFESAVGIENWTLTRSMLTDNSPYFETGAKLSYTSADDKWYVSALVVNGWQRIQRPNDNTTPFIGHQITYKPNAKLSINSSSLIGNDQSDRERKMRYFHNFYAQYDSDNQWSLLAGFDIGAQQKERNGSSYDVWFSPIIIGRYHYTDKIAISARAEYYQDAGGVIVQTDTPNGFKTQSYSANLDYALSSNLHLRTELRKFISRDDIFTHDNRMNRDNLILTSALIISF